jgi:hypothetical protein
MPRTPPPRGFRPQRSGSIAESSSRSRR